MGEKARRNKAARDQKKPTQDVVQPEEVSRRAEEMRAAQLENKRNYNEMLKAQSNEKSFQKQHQRNADLQEAQASTGFEFECYTRDKMMQDERKHIKSYQEGQKDLEQWKRQQERDESRKGNPLPKKSGESIHDAISNKLKKRVTKIVKCIKCNATLNKKVQETTP